MSSESLQKLKEQQRRLEARIQAAQARERDADRKADTRIKVLLGAWLQHRLNAGDQVIRELLQEELPKFLTREIDRKFLLPRLDLTPPRASPPDR